MMSPPLAVAIGVIGALVVLLSRPRVVALAGAAIATLLFVGIASLGSSGSTIPFGSVSALGVTGGLRLDGLSRVFALLITGIGVLIFLYAHAYLAGDARLKRLVVILILFMTSMLGAVLADDVVILFVFWELTSLTSFFLVGFDHQKASARRAALQALLVTGGGGLALLAGLILVAISAGTTSLSGIIAAKDLVVVHPLAAPAMLLIVLGCFAKSAQVPFHFWLPNAMAAPTPVSAYLHSATMVKLGVYLLARLNPVYQDVALWHGVLTVFGTATAVTGALLAFRETDLKRVLAYTTVAALGTLVMLIGIAPGLSITAAVTFLIVHAFYKAALFMVAGIVDHEVGTRDASALGGLARKMPWTAAAAVLAALSMAGLPPFVGFVAKELIYEAKLEIGTATEVLVFAGFLVNAATVAIAVVLSWRMFFGTYRPTNSSPHDPPWAMRVGPIVLASLGLLAGTAPATIGTLLVDPAAAAILGRPTDVELKLWHGFNVVLALSIVTIAVGVGVYLVWERIVPRFRAVELVDRYGPSMGYENALSGVIAFAGRLTRLIQHGALNGYIRTLFLVTAGALFLVLMLRSGFAWPTTGAEIDVRVLAFAILLLGCVAVMVAPTAFVAVLALGLVGFAMAAIFIVFGAPDVAFTQFAVETLLVVIVATALMRLPLRITDDRTTRRKLADLATALFTGLACANVLAGVLASPFDPRITLWLGEQSVPAAHGRNVVNVILVDFRALDTLGEITVLAIAAFAVVALLRRPWAAGATASEIGTDR